VFGLTAQNDQLDCKQLHPTPCFGQGLLRSRCFFRPMSRVKMAEDVVSMAKFNMFTKCLMFHLDQQKLNQKQLAKLLTNRR